MGLEERLKQRLLGGAVLVALVVIFVPMLIDEPVERHSVSDHTIPEQRVRQPKITESLPVKRVDDSQPREMPRSVPVVTRDKPVSKPDKPVSKPDKPVSKPVEPVEGSPSRRSPTAWMIQVASLTNEKNAEQLVKDLRQADMPAQMEKVRLNGKQHYRVRVGPEVDHRLAEKMVAKIEQKFKLNPKLMRYPDK
jgi:DedD protein